MTNFESGRARARNAARFFSGATRPTLRKMGRGKPISSVRRVGSKRSRSTPRVHGRGLAGPRALDEGADARARAEREADLGIAGAGQGAEEARMKRSHLVAQPRELAVQ